MKKWEDLETLRLAFFAGIERIILEAKQELGKKNIDIYISCNDEKYTSKGLNIIQNLVENGYKIFFDTNKKNIKNQIKMPFKNNAKFMITINEKEISVKNLISKNKCFKPKFFLFLKNQ